MVVLGSVCLGGAWRMFRNTYGAERICRKQSLYDSLEKPLEPYLQDLVDEVRDENLEVYIIPHYTPNNYCCLS